MIRPRLWLALLTFTACPAREDDKPSPGTSPSEAKITAAVMKLDLKSDETSLSHFGTDPPPADSDRDLLSDADEKKHGTLPNVPDTDGDGLLDGWEVHGVNGIKLPELGALPRRRDVFVEMDYMSREDATNGLGPNDEVLKRIVDVFANAPVINHDGSKGIALHLERGNEVPYDEDLSPLDVEFYALRREHFKSEIRGPVYRYMIWANAYSGDTSSGYSMNIPGSDFIVTLGRWNNKQGGTDDEKVGTFVHELGHNLGLRHGSLDDVNRKPNHLSVMNYNFQTSGVSNNGERTFGFQPFALGALDEKQLQERDGLTPKDPSLKNYETMWRTLSSAIKRGPAADPLDWTGNKKIDNAKVVVDLNDDRKKDVLAATANEWPMLKIRAGTIGSTTQRTKLHDLARQDFVVHPVKELTAEENQLIKASLKP